MGLHTIGTILVMNNIMTRGQIGCDGITIWAGFSQKEKISIAFVN